MNSLSKKEKKVRASHLALIIAFVGTIAVFFLLLCFLPKHEGELSPNERRLLAKAPTITLENIASGNFGKEVDTWLEDHFPLRNFFVASYAYMNHYFGKNAVESVIMGDEDRLFNAPTQVDESSINKNASKIEEFIEKSGLDAELVIIPSAGSVMTDSLPKLRLEYHDREMLSIFFDTCTADGIDIEELFTGTGDIGSMYYRTDHHLTMKGSYTVYRALCERLGLTPFAEEEFTKRSFDFYGTVYGTSGLMLTSPDTMEIWEKDGDSEISVSVFDGTNEINYMGILDESCLEESYVDRYACYLYSNHGLTVIENPNAEQDRTLLVLKDSYGNAIVPFLARHYSRIVMVDTRYYAGIKDTPSELAEQYGIDEFVVIYGTDSINSDISIAWLR